jgi:osmotically-inducible protein OsmY
MAIQHVSSPAVESADNLVLPTEQQNERRRLVRIKRKIRQQTSGGVQNLKIELADGTLTLRGSCNSFYCKQKAQHAAMDLLTGETLVNEIQVAAVPR